jgi:ethanolamine utilization protein EutQ (cupin superfamily)
VEVVDVANGTVRAATHTSRRQCVSVWDLFTGSNQDPMLMGQ